MGDERLWQRLVDDLEAVAVVEEREGGLVVTPDVTDNLPRVEIIMTPREWGELVGIPFGDFTSAVAHLKARWGEVGSAQRFLVYDDYDLIPSATPALPPDPDEQRLNGLLRQHPQGIGRWSVDKPDGSREYSTEP